MQIKSLIALLAVLVPATLHAQTVVTVTGGLTASTVTESLGASPSSTASTNSAAIQNALNSGGLVTLSQCGTYQINQPLVVGSGTHFVKSDCATLQLAAGSNTNMLVNSAYTQRGFVSTGPTLSSTSATGCPTYTIGGVAGRIYAQFSGGTGIGAVGYMTVSGGVPTGSVTMLNGGSYYTSVPTSGTFTNGAGTAQCSTSSTGTFTGGTIAAGSLKTVTLTWSSGSADVTVTWPTNLPSTFSAGQTYVAIFGNANPTAFNGVFPIESCGSNPCSNGNTFTYRMFYIPASAPSGTTVALQADANITVEGGTWDYNFANQSNVAGTIAGDTILISAAQNVHLKNLTFLNPTQDEVLYGMVRDFFILDSGDASTTTYSTTPAILLQFSLGQGPIFNSKIERISTLGNDDGATMMNYVGDSYQLVALSQGDVINSGIDHINRFNQNASGSSGLLAFFPGGGGFKMTGVYATNITGVVNTQGGTQPSACVSVQGTPYHSTAVSFSGSPAITGTNNFYPGLPVEFTTSASLPAGFNTKTTYYVISAGLSSTSFEVSASIGGSAVTYTGSGSGTMTVVGTPLLDQLFVDNISCSADWSFRIGSITTGIPLIANNISLDHITCNEVNVSGQTSGQTCVYVDPNTTVQNLTIDNLLAGDEQLLNTVNVPAYIYVDGTIKNFNILHPNLFASSAPANPSQLFRLSQTANIGRMVISGLTQPYGTWVGILAAGNSNTPTIIIRDSTIGAVVGISSPSPVNAIFENNIFVGTTSGMFQIDGADALAPFTATAFFRNNTLSGGAIFHGYVGGSGNAINYQALDEGGNSPNVLTLPSGSSLTATFNPVNPCTIGVPTISAGFNTNGTVSASGTACTFLVTVGSGTATNTGVLTFPAVPNAWQCMVTNQNRAALILQTNTPSPTSITVTNYSLTSPFPATTFTASDSLLFTCSAR
jgi:hypothetical protein